MEIKIALKGNRALCILLGYRTPWFGSIDWFFVTIEEYDDNFNVIFASYIFSMFRKKILRRTKMKILFVLLAATFLFSCKEQTPEPYAIDESTNEHIPVIERDKGCLEGHVMYISYNGYGYSLETKVNDDGKPIKCK